MFPYSTTVVNVLEQLAKNRIKFRLKSSEEFFPVYKGEEGVNSILKGLVAYDKLLSYKKIKWSGFYYTFVY